MSAVVPRLCGIGDRWKAATVTPPMVGFRAHYPDQRELPAGLHAGGLAVDELVERCEPDVTGSDLLDKTRTESQPRTGPTPARPGAAGPQTRSWWLSGFAQRRSSGGRRDGPTWELSHSLSG